MQHKNNNNVIANELNTIIKSLADDTDSKNISVSLEVIGQKISHLETFSQEMGIPELRALTHWMMLNIELDNNNEEQISSLLEDGSYYNWMEVLSMLLQSYDQSLLPIIYKKLTEPNWLVKPSAPLLRNLASWIESSRSSNERVNTFSAIDTLNTETKDEITEDENTTDYESPSSTDLDQSHKHIFEKVESRILEKDYKHASALDYFDEQVEDNSSEVITEKTANYYNEIEEEIVIDPIESIFSENNEIPSEVTSYKIEDEEEKVVATLDNEASNTTEDTIKETDDFSIEVDDIVMTLTAISANSDDALTNNEEYIAELQRFEMLAEISGYTTLLPISNWCQNNLSLFSVNPSDNLRKFVETGECWAWLELTKLAIEEPDELSTISELNTELNRDEWLTPLPAGDIESLILFLQDPAGNMDNDTLIVEATTADSEETLEVSIASIEDNKPDTKEYSDLSFKWHDDVHPELLEVYLEETAENITLITEYLSNISTTESTVGQREDARRVAHTIKGGSAVVGITALSTYAYQLEKILDYGIDHTLPAEAHDLLFSASNCVKSLYSAICKKESAPTDFSHTLSKLINYADTVEQLDDISLELKAPELPDFITQQNAAHNPANENDDKLSTDNKEENSATDDQIEETVEIEKLDVITGSEEIEIKPDIEVNAFVETVTVDTIEEPEKETKEIVLPALNKSEDLSDFTAELDDIIMTLVTTKVDTNKKPFNVDTYISELQRLDMLAEISGYSEIVSISNWYQNNLKLIAKAGTEELGQFITSGESWAWIELVSACLADPEDISHISELSAELTRNDWIEVLPIEDLQALLLLLRSSENNTDNEIITNQTIESDVFQENENSPAENIKIVDPEQTTDINIIKWDDDVHPELLSVYLQETAEQVTLIAGLLHLISKGKANKEQQEHAARIAHTIKGASGVVGINEIVDLTHKLEDILDYAVNNEIPADTAELLAESSDCLESLFEAAQDKAAVPEEYQPVLAKLTSYAAMIASDITIIEESLELEMPELPDFITKSGSNSLDEKDSDDNITKEENTSDVDVVAEGSEEQPIEKSKIQELAQEITQVSNETPNNVEEKQTSTLKSKNSPVAESHIRVPTELINKLLNLTGELVTTSSQVSDKVEKTIVTSHQTRTRYA